MEDCLEGLPVFCLTWKRQETKRFDIQCQLSKKIAIGKYVLIVLDNKVKWAVANVNGLLVS